jgi:hypothetical protein
MYGVLTPWDKGIRFESDQVHVRFLKSRTRWCAGLTVGGRGGSTVAVRSARCVTTRNGLRNPAKVRRAYQAVTIAQAAVATAASWVAKMSDMREGYGEWCRLCGGSLRLGTAHWRLRSVTPVSGMGRA